MKANTRAKLYNERMERLVANCDLILWEMSVKKGKILFNYSFSSQDGNENDQSEYTVSAWTALIHPCDRQDTLDSINRLIEAEADSLIWEVRIKTDQNNWKWMLIKGKVTKRDNTGKAVRITGCQIDITERVNFKHLRIIESDFRKKLAGVSDLSETLILCLNETVRVTDMDSGGVYLVNEDDGSLHLECHIGLSNHFVQERTYYSSDFPYATKIRKGVPVYKRFEEHLNDQKEGLKVLAVIPILSGDNLIAALIMASHEMDEIKVST